MTKDEISKIKEHIEIHARKEPHAVKITKTLRKAVAELEYLAELEKAYSELLEQCTNLGGIKLAQETALSTEYAIEEQLKAKLVEAKEIIKNIIRTTWGEGWNYSLDWKVKAEQFLEETN